MENEDEALDFIASVKKKHAQARHNVYAYIIRAGENSSERIRFTDDGEPSGTAGKPTLETLQHAGLVNVACVVTRYFGGTLLGTGGLVRAYSGSVKEAIEAAEVIALIDYETHTKHVFYADFEKLKLKIASQKGIIDEIDYAEDVKITYRLPKQ